MKNGKPKCRKVKNLMDAIAIVTLKFAITSSTTRWRLLPVAYPYMPAKVARISCSGVRDTVAYPSVSYRTKRTIQLSDSRTVGEIPKRLNFGVRPGPFSGSTTRNFATSCCGQSVYYATAWKYVKLWLCCPPVPHSSGFERGSCSGPNPRNAKLSSPFRNRGCVNTPMQADGLADLTLNCSSEFVAND
jgi:hypothetical protein